MKFVSICDVNHTKSNCSTFILKMHSVSEDSIKIDNQDEVMTKDQPRDEKKPALTSKTSCRHGRNRVLPTWARSELIATENQVRKVT